VARLSLGTARDWLLADPLSPARRVVLVLATVGESRPAQTLEAERRARSAARASGAERGQRASLRRITGIPKSVLYRKALERAK